MRQREHGGLWFATDVQVDNGSGASTVCFIEFDGGDERE